MVAEVIMCENERANHAGNNLSNDIQTQSAAWSAPARITAGKGL
jgi:hypothetical protein